MKKFFVFVTILVMVLVAINLYSPMSNKGYSDKELVELYLAEKYGDNYDELVVDGSDSEMIDYIAYDDNEIVHGGCINREFFTNRYK